MMRKSLGKVAAASALCGLAFLALTAAPVSAQTPPMPGMGRTPASTPGSGMGVTQDMSGMMQQMQQMQQMQDVPGAMQTMQIMLQTMQGMTETMQGMMDVMQRTMGPTVPPVRGFAEGQEIRFLHTEASDPQVAQMLTDMMGSPVLIVPSLAQVPEAALANVYVFTNGIKGGGPFGFQPDVFDSPPGTDGYSPLRAVNLVAWKTEGAAHELRSATEVQDAAAKGEVTIQRPGVVVTMPFVTWPGGQR